MRDHQSGYFRGSKRENKGARLCFLEDLPSDERNELLKFCYYMDRQVYCNTKLSDIMIRGSGLTQYHDSPVFFCNHFGMEISKRAVKKMF